MPPRRRWTWVLVAAFVLLLLGRWAAEGTTDALWAAALGAAEPHARLRELRLVLLALALAGGAAWTLGNLYLFTRSVGAVQVPRRVGDLEILEQVPRRYIVAGAAALGLLLAVLLGWSARGWWLPRALWDAARPADLTEPVLQRDAGWYLFRLPWLLTLQRFALRHTATMLAVILALYALIGALRVRARGVAVSDMARLHVGGLLVALALALFWGYRLEPAEHVAGLSAVPADAVLLQVRLPVARLLAAMALVAGGAAALWMWAGRAALVLVPWAVLGGASVVGHYFAPALAGATTPPPTAAASSATMARFAFAAYGLPPDTTLDVPVPPPDLLGRRAPGDGGVPVWDPFAVTFTLDRTLPGRPMERFQDAHLAAVRGAQGLEPVWLTVREIDLESARQAEDRLAWADVHGATYGRTHGAAAVHAIAVSERGLPLYYARLDAAPQAAAVALAEAREGLWFTPGMADFALAPADGRLQGIPLGGPLRRLALAWALQSPQLLGGGLADEALLLVERAVGRRLARLAPFARFGAAYPALLAGRVVWLSAGYVWAEGYPLAPAAAWRGRTVRYLRLGFIGTVDGATGATALYLAPGADPLATAWAEITRPLVRPADALPAALAAAVRYPEELLRVQAELARRAAPGTRVAQPTWLVGPGLTDPQTRLRLRAPVETEAEGAIRLVVEGAMIGGEPRLARVRLADTAGQLATGPLARALAREAAPLAAIPGPIKLLAFPEGIAATQTYYADPGEDDRPPWVAEVAVGWNGAGGRGATRAAAIDAIRPLAGTAQADAARLRVIREWFERLDRARSASDWEAFGVAWARLKELLAEVEP